jgi:hypothetical protein
VAQYTFSIHVDAPPELVFALWTNLQRMGEWVGGVTSVTDLSGRWIVWRPASSFRAGQSPRSPQAEPPRRFATWFGAWVLRQVLGDLEPEGDGTRVTQEFKRSAGSGDPVACSRGSYEGSFRGEPRNSAGSPSAKLGSSAQPSSGPDPSDVRRGARGAAQLCSKIANLFRSPPS